MDFSLMRFFSSLVWCDKNFLYSQTTATSYPESWSQWPKWLGSHHNLPEPVIYGDIHLSCTNSQSSPLIGSHNGLRADTSLYDGRLYSVTHPKPLATSRAHWMGGQGLFTCSPHQSSHQIILRPTLPVGPPEVLFRSPGSGSPAAPLTLTALWRRSPQTLHNSQIQ